MSRPLSPLRPYALIWFDGQLATYAGVSPHEPIGEPVQEAWETVRALLESNLQVTIITWRESALIAAWMDRSKLFEMYQHPGLQITNTLPPGLPVILVGPNPSDIHSAAAYARARLG